MLGNYNIFVKGKQTNNGEHHKLAFRQISYTIRKPYPIPVTVQIQLEKPKSWTVAHILHHALFHAAYSKLVWTALAEKIMIC